MGDGGRFRRERHLAGMHEVAEEIADFVFAEALQEAFGHEGLRHLLHGGDIGAIERHLLSHGLEGEGALGFRR